MKSKKIVITRSIHQAGEVANLLREQGANPLFYPCIEIAAPDDTRELDSALYKADQDYFDWIVFTSANTVFSIANRLAELSLSPSRLNTANIAAIGPATSLAVENYLNLDVNLMPEDYAVEALVDVFPSVSEKNILLPQSNLARPYLAEKLTEMGAEVLAIAAYQTKIGTGGFDLSAGLAKNEIDAITFTSSSSIFYFLDRLKISEIDIKLLDGICIACFGSITAETARQAGLSVSVQTSENTFKNLAFKLTEYFDQSELLEKEKCR